MKNLPTFIRPILIATFYAFVSVALVGCHHPRTISKTETGKTTPNPAIIPMDAKVQQLIKLLRENQPEFRELSARLKTRVSSPSMNQSFTTNIRWKKGEKIWLSMSIIGIEGARVLITKDSIKIMDKINERYMMKPLSYIKEKTFVDLSFTDIENLLLGQLIFTDTARSKYADNSGNITVSSDGARFLTNILFEINTKHLKSIFVTDKLYAQTIESTYDNYQSQLGKSFSMDRNLRARSGLETFEMDAKFQAIEIKQNQEYPFPINPGYTIEK